MEEVFKCAVCSEEFESRDKLNAHTERQHEKVDVNKKNNFNCNICGLKCSTGFNLITHTRIHTGERPFKCEVADCQLAFKQKSDLNGHIKYKHSDERPLKCEFPDCVYKTKTSSSLRSHMNMHNAGRPYTCPNDECSFRANRKGHVTRHIKRVHNQAKKFSCTKCDYATAESGHLKRHMRRHSATRDFKCSYPQCTASFKHSSHLKRHLSSLHGQPNIQCDRPGCGQYENTTQALKDHLKLHNPSSWPFQCPLCLRHFRTMQQIQRHCFVHTNEKPFQCGHCKYEAASRTKVKAHISSAHANIHFPVIVHLVDDRECLHCKVILPSAKFLIHSQRHEDPVAKTKTL